VGWESARGGTREREREGERCTHFMTPQENRAVAKERERVRERERMKGSKGENARAEERESERERKLRDLGQYRSAER